MDNILINLFIHFCFEINAFLNTKKWIELICTPNKKKFCLFFRLTKYPHHFLKYSIFFVIKLKIIFLRIQPCVIKLYNNFFSSIHFFKNIILGVQISSVRSKMHLFQNKMNEQIN